MALCFAKTFFRCGVFEETDAAFEDHLYACVVFLILKCGALKFGVNCLCVHLPIGKTESVKLLLILLDSTPLRIAF